MEKKPQVEGNLLIIDASRSHSDTRQSIGLLWTSDKPDTKAPNWQHTTLTRDRYPFLRRDNWLQLFPPPMTQQPLGGRDLHIIEASRSHLSGILWTSDQLDAENSDNTQHSHETDVHATVGIRNSNPSKQATADTCLRPRGHLDDQLVRNTNINFVITKFTCTVKVANTLMVTS